MSRSVRKRPFAAYCGGSQKDDKRTGNRVMRRNNRIRLAAHGDDRPFMTYDEALNPWTMSQDGTRHYQPYDGRIEYERWHRWVKRK